MGPSNTAPAPSDMSGKSMQLSHHTAQLIAWYMNQRPNSESLPLALAHAVAAAGPWGSCLSDIAAALDRFCAQYDLDRRLCFMEVGLPGCRARC